MSYFCVSALRRGICALVLTVSAGEASGQLIDLPEGIPSAASGLALTAGVPGYETSPAVSAATRRERDYDPLRIRYHGFLIGSTLTEGLGYDSNPAGQPQAVGSLVETTEAAVRAASDWNRNAVTFFGGLDDHRYPQQPQQSTTNWTLATGGAYDIDRDQLTGSFLHLSSYLTPRDLNIPQITEPEPYSVNDLRLGYRAELSRLALTPTVDYALWRYDNLVQNGAPVVLTFQSRNVATASLTASYEVSTLRHLLLVTRAINTHYVQPIAGDPNRDSVGPDLLVGLNYGTGGVWRYRALIGYQARYYASSFLTPARGFTAEGDLVWTPSGLTKVTASFLRSLEENAASVSVVGYTLTHGRLVVDHEYRHDVLLQAHAEADRASYQQGGGQATILNAGVEGTWLLNRNMRATISYEYTDRLSGSTSFTENVVLVRLRLAL